MNKNLKAFLWIVAIAVVIYIGYKIYKANTIPPGAVTNPRGASPSGASSNNMQGYSNASMGS